MLCTSARLAGKCTSLVLDTAGLLAATDEAQLAASLLHGKDTTPEEEPHTRLYGIALHKHVQQ